MLTLNLSMTSVSMITGAVQLSKVHWSKVIQKNQKTYQSRRLAEGIRSGLRLKAKEVAPKVGHGGIPHLIQITLMEVGYLVLGDLLYQIELEDKFNVRTHNRQTNQTNLFATQIANGWTKRTAEDPLHL
jgi:hypothetical protein